MVHHAEDEYLLHPGLFGSRPARNSVDPIVLEELQLEYSRLGRRPLGKFSNDAKSCYDRILASIASLSSRHHGMSHAICLIMAHTLEEAEYRVKTFLKTTDGYKNTSTTPIYGTGQGSGCSPGIWLVICNNLFHSHQTQAKGARAQM